MPKERKRPSFILLLSSSLFFLFFLPSHGKCFIRVYIHIECKKRKEKSFIGLGPCIPLVFPFKKSFLFCFDLSTRCLTYAQQSTIVTRNRNFVSMVLIKYPHQYREEERKRGGNGVRGTEEVENQRENERFSSASECVQLCVGDLFLYL